MVQIHENKGESTKVKMNSEDAAVPSPEFNSKSLQALKDYPLDTTIHPTRMYKKLPECFVVLHRLTEEDLYRSYPSDSAESYDDARETDELCDTVAEEFCTSRRKDGSLRRVRKSSKLNTSAFELYKQKRERYMSRKSRAYHSENSLDFSQDESRTFSDGAKPKKKLKRGHRYERDYEWRPDIPKGIRHSDRKLRVRTSVIESESSSSDEEDLYDDFMYDYTDANEEIMNSLNPGPSEGVASTSGAKNNEFEKQSSDKASFSHQNSSSSSTMNYSSQLIDPVCDIVSDIIKSMDNQHPNNRFKTSYSSVQHSSSMKSNDFKRKTEENRKRQKRPRKLSGSDKNIERESNKVVAKILNEMVNKVSSKLKHPGNKTNKTLKSCKWCATPFQPNRNSDVYCAICTDLGKGAVNKSGVSIKKPANSGKVKCFKENKGKKSCSSAFSRVLKNLSENDKRRFLYSEKSDKLSSSKGYNHCKSFTVPKEASIGDSTSQIKSPNKLSLKGNRSSTAPKQKNNKSNANVNSMKGDKSPVESITKSPTNTEKQENKQSKSRVSLENYKEGLFLMTFPDPDEEIDFDGQLTQSQTTKSGSSFENGNLNNKKLATSESLSSPMKQSQTVSTQKYDTYLFPPIPTVIVSNYCSDTNSLNLSHTYFQNEITHQHAIKNSTTQSSTVNSHSITALNKTVSNAKNTVVSNSSAMAYQNSPSLATNNVISTNSLPGTTFSVSSNNFNQITIKSISSLNPETSRNNFMLPKTSVHSGNVTKTPIILPKPSVSNVSILPKPSVPASNVTLLPILTSVVSLANTVETDKMKENVPSTFSNENFINSQLLDIKIDNVTSLNSYETCDQSLLNSEPVTIKNVNKRLQSDLDNGIESAENNSSVKRKKLNTDRCSSDAIKNSNIEKDNTASLVKDNQSSNLSAGDKSEYNKTDQLGTKESDKSSGIKENDAPQSAISATQSAIDLLGAISILAVIDLEKNPQTGLNVRIQLTKNQLGKLTSEKISTPEHNERIASCQYNLQLLNIAKKYLSLYGSFTKVSDHLLRKANMIQIKKELHEEETNQSSCMFSQPSLSNNSFSEGQPNISRPPQISPANNQMQNFTSSGSNLQSPIDHIEKLKCQIAAMNNAAMNNVNVDFSQYGSFPGVGTVHHYATQQISALNPAVAAPTPVTPRNDCLPNESRETPSRGSGPRTPARPESAASQSEDTASLIQIKKEQFETNPSPSTQCAYAQNTSLSQISSQLPDISTFNMPQQSIVNTSVHFPVSSASMTYTNQSNYNINSGNIAPNRTVYSNHQNYSDMYLNVASKPQLQITSASPNAEMRQNQQVLLGQQMYIQNGSGLCSKQAVPSVNNSQYVIRPPYTSASTGGTLIVNNTQVGQNALLTNVSNQQFYTSNPVSQLYYPPSQQMTCMPSNNIPTMITQEVAATQVQQTETPEQMICAVCNKQATLRCKQCARVAYCNTACAKTYWHQKHKMECKPLGS